MIATGTVGRRFDSPIDVRYRLGPVSVNSLVSRAATVTGLAYEVTPAVRVIGHIRNRRGQGSHRGDGGRAI